MDLKSTLSSKKGPRKGIKYWEQKGFEKAGLAKGNHSSFKTNLEEAYHNFKVTSQYDADQIEKINLKLNIKKNELETKKEKLSKDKTNEGDKIPEFEKEIQNLKEEISAIKQDPEANLDIEKPDKLGFYSGVFIIFFLTIYLWVFYSSATYSAFFRQITFTENVVFNSVFYAKAIADSLNAGTTAFILILVAPFIFIALGYLIHRFSEEKSFTNYMKMSALITITFIFDCILAYEITKKIYDYKIETLFGDFPAYNLNIAFEDVNFWLIIFAGFVVYIAWGIILSFVAEGFHSFDYVRTAIKNRKKKISDINHSMEDVKGKIHKLDSKITKIEGAIDTVNKKLRADIFDTTILKNNINAFLSGWIRYLVGSTNDAKEIKLAETTCKEFLEKKIKDINWVEDE